MQKYKNILKNKLFMGKKSKKMRKSLLFRKKVVFLQS